MAAAFQESLHTLVAQLQQLCLDSADIECLRAWPDRSPAEQSRLVQLEADRQFRTSQLPGPFSNLIRNASAVLGKLHAQPRLLGVRNAGAQRGFRVATVTAMRLFLRYAWYARSLSLCHVCCAGLARPAVLAKEGAVFAALPGEASRDLRDSALQMHVGDARWLRTD